MFVGSWPPSNLSINAPVFHLLPPAPCPVPQQVLSGQTHPTANNTKLLHTSICRDTVVGPQRSTMTMSRSIVQPDAPMQGRSTTQSSSGSPVRSLAQKTIMRGLWGVVREYWGLGSLSAASLLALVSMHGRPSSGPSSSSIQLETGMCQMSCQDHSTQLVP